MSDLAATLLIVGLGNPGKAYELTRHNIGFKILQEIARQLGSSFQVKKEFHGECAQGIVGDKKVFLLMPTTYMNLSGEAVKAFTDFYKMSPEQVLVICDDVYLPFGKLRLKDRGSSGGHNGLKNIEKMLVTSQYIRLKVGVDHNSDWDLADYVLAPFLKEEQEKLPSVIKEASDVALTWVRSGYTPAIQCIQKHEVNRTKALADKKTQEEKKIKET